MRYLIVAKNASVGIEGSAIVEPSGKFDHVIEAPTTDIRPGLINAHDHLHRNHYGRLGKPPYPNAFVWAQDIQQRYRRRIATGRRRPRREALLRGAWKNLFSGVTTVVHHDPWEPDFERGFPIKVARLQTADSIRAEAEIERIEPESRYCVHLAEGFDWAANEELAALADRQLLTANLIAVHCVGLDHTRSETLRSSGAALVWCPTSNLFMLDQTAPSALLRSGIDVLLGSDSLLTGAGNLLDEVRFARSTGAIGDDQLEQSIGSKAAARLGIPQPVLQPGSPADLILIEKPVLEASANDVALVIVDGVPRVASRALASSLSSLAPRVRRMTIASVTRWVNPEPEMGINQ